MLDIPSREALAELTHAASAIVPLAALGFARIDEDAQVAVLYSTAEGFGAQRHDPADVPDALLPAAPGVRHLGPADIRAHPERAIEWHLQHLGVERLLSLPVPGVDPPARLWVGTSDPGEPASDRVEALQALAVSSGAILNRPASPAETAERMQRLELAAGLLPALLRVLDVREVFDRLSSISQAALPHDALAMALLDDTLTTATLYASTAAGPMVTRKHTHPYPPAFIRGWDFDILDDLQTRPYERDLPGLGPGLRSTLRLPIRFENRVIAGVSFNTAERARFSSHDVVVARRLADHVAVALSHQQMAEEARLAAARQERTASLDLLDSLMGAITEVLDVRDALDRIHEISQRALVYDALSIAIPSADGTRVRLHARSGALRDLPAPLDSPLGDPSLLEREWDFLLKDDCLADPRYADIPSVKAGMRALLIIPVRLELQLRAWVNFWSATPGRFTNDDVPVARRIAAHITLTLSHERLAEQSRQTEELRARTASLELLDELLSALGDSGDLADVFGRISTAAGKVLGHDAAALMVRLPDGHRARVYASDGFPPAVPDTTEIPADILARPDWDHDIIDDLTTLEGPSYALAARLGFLSVLRVAIRLNGIFAGAILFLAKARSAFRPADFLAARRVADRLTVSLARERGLDAARHAYEATERAAKLEARVRMLTEELDARTGYRRVVGESAEWRQVLTQATQVAATETTVLLLGESGTGKEVVARFLHRASSRSAGPFVALNCAALPEQLLEAELFGYERGAFTGAVQSKPGQLEQAAGGTLFLDEVGEMSPPAQAKFLRVLQEREFQRLGGTRVLRTDARLVAATNRDLQRAIANGLFREDLYYRLNVFAIRLPALRDRPGDILPLSEAFLGEIGRSIGRPPAGISRDARQRLIEYRWPGNVRELRNVLERAAILCDGGLVTADHLNLAVSTPRPPSPPDESARPAALPGRSPAARPPVPARPGAAAPPASAADLQTMERAMIEQALQGARFNKSKAAKSLGLTRRQLYVRLRKYGFE